jgi:hypothetical protein
LQAQPHVLPGGNERRRDEDGRIGGVDHQPLRLLIPGLALVGRARVIR